MIDVGSWSGLSITIPTPLEAGVGNELRDCITTVIVRIVVVFSTGKRIDDVAVEADVL